MSDIKIMKDSKLVKVQADQAARKRVDSASVEEASAIMKTQAENPNPENRHQLAQVMAYTIEDLQKTNMDFLERVADIKNIGYGDKAVFNVKTGGIKAYYQAKGATTARSYISDRSFALETQEISARPAINIVDLRAGRVNMADLIREANDEMTNMKLSKVEAVLHDAMDDFAAPFYASGTGIVKATLDNQLNYFRRIGPVTILGDIAAIAQMVGITGMATNAGGTLLVNASDNMIDEANNNGYLGKYNGMDVVALQNAYHDGSTTPVLATDWLYIIPAGLSADQKNLKIVNEGGVNAMESQNIDDMVFEVRLDQWFGAGFVKKNLPTIGAYKIN